MMESLMKSAREAQGYANQAQNPSGERPLMVNELRKTLSVYETNLARLEGLALRAGLMTPRPEVPTNAIASGRDKGPDATLTAVVNDLCQVARQTAEVISELERIA